MSYLVLGVDVGYSAHRKTSGLLLARVQDRVLSAVEGPIHLTEVGAQTLARRLCEEHDIAAVALDAPLATTHQHDYRPVEKVFSRGAFQQHCKPGPTSSRVGRELHAAGMKLLSSLAGPSYANFSELNGDRRNVVVEVFPTGALGVLVGSSERASATRRQKSDMFFELVWRSGDRNIGGVRLAPELWRSNHDERMACVAAALAACYVEGEFSAVGHDSSGYFLMPHVSSWKPEWITEIDRTLSTVPDARLVSMPT